MLQIDWKTYIAARKDKSAGNKDTSVFTKAWSPEKNRSTFSNVDHGPRPDPFRHGLKQEGSCPPQLQECRRHLAPSREEDNVPFGHRITRNSTRSQPFDRNGRLQSGYSDNRRSPRMHGSHRSSRNRGPKRERPRNLSRFSHFSSSPLASRSSDSGKFK